MNLWLAASRFPFLDDAQLEEGGLERTAQSVYHGAFDHISDTFPILAGVLICGGLLLLLVAAWGWQRHQRRHLRSDPMLVFHQMATAAGLSLKQQWLLATIARRQSLPTPLTLMLSGATLKHYAQRYAESVGPRRRKTTTAGVAVITRVLFGDADAMATAA